MDRQRIKNRRAAPRFDASAIPALKSISRIGGPTVKIINISRRGALLESRERLAPGSSIALRLTTEKDVYFIKGRITRSQTYPRIGRAFQSAVAFREDFNILPASIDTD
jgi:hypothetical protein